MRIGRTYARVFLFAARDQLAYLPSFLVRNVFFVVIVFVFWSLWRVIYADRPLLAGLTLAQTLWYLTFTETIELSKSRLSSQVSEDVRDGTVAITMCRPYSWPLFHLARAMGESVVKILPILAMGFLLGVLFVGPLPGYLRVLPGGILLILLGILVTNLWLLLIGLLSFWTEEVAPFAWILQKLVFILGGMFLPIGLFPPWLAGIARALPFAFSAYWPAYAIVTGAPAAFLTALGGAAGYAAALGAAAALLYRRGRRRLQAQGG